MMEWLTYVVAALAVAILFYFYRKWAAGGVCTLKVDLHDKVIVITGGNTGLGFETAKALVKMGAHVILACRDKKRATQAVEALKKDAEDNKAKVEYMTLDLSSFSSVREFAKKYKERNLPLDVLINNAGVMWCPYAETEDGYETQFAVNHLGHFLLTILLLDVLKKTKDSRIVNISSLASEYDADIAWEDVNRTKNFNTMHAYAQSKLANVLFTEELNRRLRGTGVTTYSVHPGAVATELGRYVNKLLLFLISPPVCYLFPLKSPEQGAQTQIYCAIAPNIEKYSGMYFADCQVKKNLNKLAGEKEAGERLWKMSEEMVKEKYPS